MSKDLRLSFVDIEDRDDVRVTTKAQKDLDLVLRISFRLGDDFHCILLTRLPMNAPTAHRISPHL